MLIEEEEEEERTARVSVRYLDIGHSTKSLFGHVSPLNAKTPVFHGRFVCLRSITSSDMRLQKIDILKWQEDEISHTETCRDVLNGLIEHVVRNQNNETLQRQRKILMRIRRRYLSYLRNVETPLSSTLSYVPERDHNVAPESNMSPFKMRVTMRDEKTSTTIKQMKSIAECMTTMIVKVSQDLVDVDTNRIVPKTHVSKTSEILSFQHKISIWPLKKQTRVRVRCSENIYYDAIVLSSRREHDCICTSCFSEYPHMYRLRVLEVVPEMQTEEMEIMSRCAVCGKQNYTLCFSKCHDRNHFAKTGEEVVQIPRRSFARNVMRNNT